VPRLCSSIHVHKRVVKGKGNRQGKRLVSHGIEGQIDIICLEFQAIAIKVDGSFSQQIVLEPKVKIFSLCSIMERAL